VVKSLEEVDVFVGTGGHGSDLVPRHFARCMMRDNKESRKNEKQMAS